MSNTRRWPSRTWLVPGLLALGFCWVAMAALDFQHSSRPFVTGLASLGIAVASFVASWIYVRRPRG
jgi:hypothetical protein